MKNIDYTGDSDNNIKNKLKISFNFILLIFFIIILSIVCFSIFYFKYKQMKSYIETNKIYNNIFINDIDVGNMTYDEAIENVKNKLLLIHKNKKIILVFDKEFNEYSFEEFNPILDIEEAVKFAFNYGKEGTLNDRYIKVKHLNDKPLKIEVNYNFDICNVKKVILELSSKYNKNAINAIMIKTNNNFIVKEGINGIKINVDDVSEKVYNLLKEGKEGKVEVTFDIIKPRYDAKSFENAKSIIGTYSTKFRSCSIGRSTNMNVASERINGYILYPDEVFSTNKIFGSRVAENGYKMAPVIVGGELVDDIGGGICQISTNLYMAALFAELNIIERHNHSKKVAYADYGFDATLAYDYIDLKFKNNTKKPIYIESIVKDNISTVNIYGEETRNVNRKIYFKNELVEVIPAPSPIFEKDSTILKGTTITKTQSIPGYKYNLYKIVTENEIEVSRQLINKSYYRPKSGIIKVGTGMLE